MKKCCSNEQPRSPDFSLGAPADSIAPVLIASTVESSHSAGDLIVLSPYSLEQRNGEALEQQRAIDAQLAQIKVNSKDAPTL